MLKCSRGIAALEFALSFPFLLVVLGGAAEMGEMAYRRLLLNQRVTAVSVGSYYQPLPAGEEFVTDGITITVTYGIRCIVPPLLLGGITLSISGAVCSNGSSPVNVALVEGKYTQVGIITGHVTRMTENAIARIP